MTLPWDKNVFSSKKRVFSSRNFIFFKKSHFSYRKCLFLEKSHFLQWKHNFLITINTPLGTLCSSQKASLISRLLRRYSFHISFSDIKRHSLMQAIFSCIIITSTYLNEYLIIQCFFFNPKPNKNKNIKKQQQQLPNYIQINTHKYEEVNKIPIIGLFGNQQNYHQRRISIPCQQLGHNRIYTQNNNNNNNKPQHEHNLCVHKIYRTRYLSPPISYSFCSRYRWIIQQTVSSFYYTCQRYLIWLGKIFI